MKKLFYVCLIVMLVLGLSVAASAAGETVTVTATDNGATVDIVIAISGSEPVLGCDVKVDLPSNVFDGTGQWLIDGKDTGEGLQWDTPTNINGRIFKMTLTVRAGATPKVYTIGCTVTVTTADGTPATYTNVQTAQVCVHDYQQSVKAEFLAAEATCQAPASYYVSCAACGKVGTETFPDGEPVDHVFDQKVEEQEYLDPDHPGDCVTNRRYFYSCECGEAGKSTFKSERLGEHVYDNACDPECNICGRFNQDAEHEPSEEWFSNSKEHWRICQVCDEKLEPAEHEPVTDKEDDRRKVCDICEYIIDTGDGTHVHQYDGQWRMDEKSHWYLCECGHVAELSAHEWDRGVALQEATEKEAGLIEYTCETCGKSKVEEVAPIGGGGDTKPTVPPQSLLVEEGEDTNVLAIVLGVFLILSLCGNAILTYLLVANTDRRQRRR